MLRVSYPYLLSVETGQRDMSEALARKVSWLVGVSSTDLLKNKTAKPMSFDDTANNVVPFSLESYRQHRAQFPKFYTLDHEEELTPTLEGYTKIFHALLDSAVSMHRLGHVMPLFFKFFADSIPSGTAVGAFIASLHRLYPEDRDALNAMAALLGPAAIGASSPELRKEIMIPHECDSFFIASPSKKTVLRRHQQEQRRQQRH